MNFGDPSELRDEAQKLMATATRLLRAAHCLTEQHVALRDLTCTDCGDRYVIGAEEVASTLGRGYDLRRRCRPCADRKRQQRAEQGARARAKGDAVPA